MPAQRVWLVYVLFKEKTFNKLFVFWAKVAEKVNRLVMGAISAPTLLSGQYSVLHSFNSGCSIRNYQ